MLLEQAKRLREEADALEQQVGSSRAERQQQTITPETIQVTDLKNSIWTISYRFSRQPETEDTKNQETDKIITNYPGRITLQFRSDGYTDILSTGNDDQLEIQKVWGWDKEYSQDDDQYYLLFSMDFLFPESTNSQSERYYFQARVDTTNTEKGLSVLKLSDGTVTVKRDVSERTKGVWGFFSVTGILTEFRQVGSFVAKPTTSSGESQT